MIPIKVVKLVTGETIIAGYTELSFRALNSDEELKMMMLLKCPYILNIQPLMGGEFTPDGSPKELSVNFAKWNPFTNENQFKVPINHMVSVAEPDPQILSIYINKFGDDLNEWDVDSSDSTEEPGLSDSGDRGEGGEP